MSIKKKNQPGVTHSVAGAGCEEEEEVGDNPGSGLPRRQRRVPAPRSPGMTLLPHRMFTSTLTYYRNLSYSATSLTHTSTHHKLPLFPFTGFPSQPSHY